MPATAVPPSTDVIMLRRTKARSVGRESGNATCSATTEAGVGPVSSRMRTASPYETLVMGALAARVNG